MLKLKKYFKAYWFLLIILVALQAFRAYGTVKLPDYMQEIVDVGLQNGGVEELSPEVISAESFEKINGLLTLLGENVDLFNNSYEVIDEASLSDKELSDIKEKFTKVDTSKDLIFIQKDEDKIAKIEDLLKTPTILMYLSSEEYQTSEFKTTVDETMASSENASDMQISQEMLMGPNGAEILKSIDSKLSEIPEQYSSMIIVEGIKVEYANLGVDLHDMEMSYIYKSAGKMIIFSLFVFITTVSAYFLAIYVSTGIGKRLRHDVFSNTLTFSNKEFEKFSTASLITRNTNDVTQLSNSVAMILQLGLFAPIQAVLGCVTAYQSSSTMLKVIAISASLILLLFIIVAKISIPKMRKLQTLIDRLNLVTREILSGVMVVRAFGNEKLETEKFNNVNSDIKDTNLKIAIIQSTTFPLIMIVFNITMVAIVYFGAINVDNGTMGIGDIMANTQYAASILMAFIFMSMISFMIPKAQISANRINEVLETKTTIYDGKEDYKVTDGVLEFKDVSFKYSSGEETETVLSHVSFKAEPNKVTAIIGSTGSGKSSLVNLIPRFYDVTSGSIEIDGHNINDFKLDNLRQGIAIVPQKGFLFSGTINSTITFANDLSDEEIVEIARISESENFIESKDDKYDSEISQGGKNVSGGQRQRLAIARAIAKDSKVLIFDDSFSALDYKTDKKLRENLKKSVHDVTMIIVAQRISTIMDADQIIVLDQGEIVGCGKHEELLNDCEVYQEIANSQIPKEVMADE